MPKGRPAVAGTARTKTLEIRLTPAERATIDRRAVSLGKGASTYARDLLLEDAAKAEPVKKPAKKKR